jgi:hypothetical protein
VGKIVYNDNTNVVSDEILYQTFAQILNDIVNDTNEEDNNETDDRIS